MKVSKAMKQIARIKGQLSIIDNRMHDCISTISPNDFKEDFNNLQSIRTKLINDLNNLKVLVMQTNIKHDMFKTILELGELKSQLELYKSFTIKSGIFTSGYSETQTEYKSQISEADRNKIIDELQNKINDLTDKLDEFNASTNLVM